MNIKNNCVFFLRALLVGLLFGYEKIVLFFKEHGFD
jgi:hypothetical protein